MVEIPDNVRTMLALLRKYNFWILAVLVPLILLPLLAVGNAALLARITAQQRKIEAALGQVRSVSSVDPHPNEQWITAIVKRTEQVDTQTRQAWEQLWKSQAFLRVWPEELGPEFLAAVTSLEPGGRLDRPALLNYQRRVLRFARGLAARMGVPERMSDVAMQGRRPEDPQAIGPRPPVNWDAADQQRLAKAFSWPRPPSTEQVLLAQEELWVYGQFCDLIRGFNASATGPHDAAITIVEQLAVGYPAAEDDPGGRSGGRIFVPPPPRGQPVDTGRTGEEAPESFNPSEPEGAAKSFQFVRPVHPRFRDGQEAGAAGPPLDQLNWAYVDFAGQPLLAQELASAPGVDMVRLMPFLLRVVMDQRQIDRLLVQLATWPLPIDVRQVRINPMSQAGGRGSGFQAGFDQLPPGGGGRVTTDQAGDLAGPRPYDVTVEIRGTAALATRPAAPETIVVGAADPEAVR